MEISHEDVAAILDLIERSNIEYLEVEIGGTRIVADRSSSRAHAHSIVTPPPMTSEHASPPASLPPLAIPPSTVPRPNDQVHTVNAPMVGVFYRAPEPGAAAFVELGSRIEVGDTIGLIEVMKMFNSVTASVSGEVLEILADANEFVEFGQPLFRILPT